MEKIRIGYFADGPWGHESLRLLLADASLEVAFVCGRYDNPDAILRDITEKFKLEFLVHAEIKSDDFFELVSEYRSDLFVSMSFNQIFSSRLIKLPALGIINCHAGKLPFYRGRNVLNWALINDEREFGITVHYVDCGIDTGNIILQRCYPISDNDDYSSLLRRAHVECANILYDSIKIIQDGNLKPITQSAIDPLGFYCVRRGPGDERLSWCQRSRDVFNFVRAVCRPGPEARTFLGSNEVKINRVQYLPDATIYKGIVGSVVGVQLNSFFVKTLDSYVKVVEWSGYPNPRIGDRFE